MKRLKKKAQSKEVPGETLLKPAAKTFKDKGDVAKEHDKYLYSSKAASALKD